MALGLEHNLVPVESDGHGMGAAQITVGDRYANWIASKLHIQAVDHDDTGQNADATDL